MQRAEIIALICEAVKETLDMKGEAGSVEVNESTITFGDGSAIDSLDLVSIIVRIEESILDQIGKTIVMVDEASLITGDSPFKTVGSLATLVEERLHA